jgi:hypothetical protein
MGNQLSQREKDIGHEHGIKEEFKDIEIHDGGGLNLIVIRDTQSSRKIDFHGCRGIFFLTFGFKDVSCSRRESPVICLRKNTRSLPLWFKSSTD